MLRQRIHAHMAAGIDTQIIILRIAPLIRRVIIEISLPFLLRFLNIIPRLFIIHMIPLFDVPDTTPSRSATTKISMVGIPTLSST